MVVDHLKFFNSFPRFPLCFIQLSQCWVGGCKVREKEKKMVSERMKAITTGVMSVEFAMQREIAYGQKMEELETELLQQFNCFEKDYMHLSPPMPAPSQVPVQHEFPIPPSKSCLGRSDSLRLLPCQPQRFNPTQRVPTPGTRSFARPGDNAYLSQQQMPRTPTLNSVRRKEPSSGHHYFHSTKYSRGTLYLCKLCQLDCTTFYNLHLHRLGQKHKARAMELGIQGKEPFNVANELIRCELCDIVCMNVSSLKQHREGKNHAINLQKKISELEEASSSKELFS